MTSSKNTKALTAARERVNAIKADIKATKHCHVDLATALASVEGYVATRGKDDPAMFFASHQWPHEPVNSGGFILWSALLFNDRETILESIKRRVRVLYEPGGELHGKLALSPSDKEARLAQLKRDLFAAERAEEEIIEAIEAEGVDVDRRLDADPAAILGV